MSLKALRDLIREVLLTEVDISGVGDVCYTAGSTHVMKTCKIRGDKYFLKFSDEDLFEGVDPSLQILVEYLAYRIYSLYSGINVPSPELVYDTPGSRVGLATSPARGSQALKMRIDPKKLGKMMSQGVYVDIFLANWDVIGNDSGNVFVDKDYVTRIDPGGSLTFRAQGGRKNDKFSPKEGELRSMLTSGRGASAYFQHSDLKVAAKEFLAVPWDEVQSEIDNVGNEVSEELSTRGMRGLLKQWKSDVDLIKSTLSKRHAEVEDHARHVLSDR
jgi:hypothetical protein